MAKILIVEDETSYCDILALILSRAGHDVRLAEDLQQGIRDAPAYAPDLLITDWMLKSHLHGGQVAEQIRAAHPPVKTIVITGYSDVVRLVRNSYSFVDQVIVKPFHTTEILEATDRALGLKMEPPTEN